MSACVAPLFSQRPDIHQWLHHYTQLGVNKFYMYVPTLHYHEPHHYDSPHEVRTFLHKLRSIHKWSAYAKTLAVWALPLLEGVIGILAHDRFQHQNCTMGLLIPGKE